MAKLEDAFHSVQSCLSQIGAQQERYRQVRDLYQATMGGAVASAVVMPDPEEYSHVRVSLGKDNLQSLLVAEINQVGQAILTSWDELFQAVEAAREAVQAVRDHAASQQAGG